MITAFAALVLTGEMYMASAALYSMAVALALYADVKNIRRFRLPEWAWRTLAITYLPFIVLDAGVLTARIPALVHLTMFLSAAKLFQDKRDRDWVFLYLIAFFQMLLAAGLTFDTSFIASLIVFLFFFISALAAFEIRRSRRSVTPLEEEVVTRSSDQETRSRHEWKLPEAERRVKGRARYLVGATVVQIALVVALTLPIFFLIPRIGGGGVVRGFGSGMGMTGFSETVRLGDVASIKESHRIVMRVQLSGNPARYLRWRGVALDNYNGRAWTTVDADRPGADKRLLTISQGGRRSGENSNGLSGYSPVYYLGPESSSGAAQPVRQELLEQKFLMEPLDLKILFSARRVHAIKGPMSGLTGVRDTPLRNEGDFAAIHSIEHLRGRASYTAWSDVRVPREDDLRMDPITQISAQVGRLYLQLPGTLDPRIAELAREVSRGASTPYDRARAIEAFLKTEFGYTLDLKPGEADPLAEFLFEYREGHCEYFATAMAIMLRTLGIPARVVNGFQMGDYNDINDLYTVRQSDAHSWVEVFFPALNTWVEFDPTPSAGINRYQAEGFLARLRKYLEAAEVFWLDYIVTLDREEQVSMMVGLQHAVMDARKKAIDVYQSFKRWLTDAASARLSERNWTPLEVLKVLGLVILLVLAGAAMLTAMSYVRNRGKSFSIYESPWWRRLVVLLGWRSRRLARNSPGDCAVLFYERMLVLAEQGGLLKQPHQTPLEFAVESDLDQISDITAIYNRVRFGKCRLDESDTRRIARLLEELKALLRSRSQRT